MKTIKLIFLLTLINYATTLQAASSSSANGIDLRKLLKSSSDTSLINRYINTALKYTSGKKTNADLVKAYIDSAETVCKKQGIDVPALLHIARAEYFFLVSDLNNASQEASITRKLAENSGDMNTLARAYVFQGRYNLRTGSYQESLNNFNDAINISKKNKLKGFLPGCYFYLSRVYNTLESQDEFRNALKRSIDAAVAEKDTVRIEDGCFALGSSYTNEKRNSKKADSLLKICFHLSEIKKDTSFMALSTANLGWNSYQDKKYDSAIKYYNQSLSLSVPGKLISFSSNSYGNLGTIYRDMGETEKSLKYYNKAIEHGKLINDIYNLSWVYKDLSDMYLLKGDTSNAYKSFVQHKKFSDMYLSKTSSQGLTDAKIRYDAETHKKELQLLSLKISNQKLLIYGYTGLFILGTAIVILLFSRGKINNKRRISEMNRKISEVTQANLRQQMNPHFIFNTLNSIQYYMYQHDKLATNNYLTKFSSLMRKVLENSQHTSIPIRDELEALSLFLELEKIRFKDKFDYSIKIDEEIDTILYKIPTMLIQPYVENSICHGLMPGENKGLVKIDMKLENEYISCTIEDNGIGRQASQEKKNKEINHHNSLGTQIVSSRLDLVNALYGTSLKTTYTDLKNIKGDPEGTRVEIQIPLIT